MCGKKEGTKGRKDTEKGAVDGEAPVTETYSKLNKNKALKPNRSMNH